MRIELLKDMGESEKDVTVTSGSERGNIQVAIANATLTVDNRVVFDITHAGARKLVDALQDWVR